MVGLHQPDYNVSCRISAGYDFELHTVEVRGVETRAQLGVAGAIKQIRLDPNHRLLIWRPEYGARP